MQITWCGKILNDLVYQINLGQLFRREEFRKRSLCAALLNFP
jgi:hypothetical protein